MSNSARSEICNIIKYLEKKRSLNSIIRLKFPSQETRKRKIHSRKKSRNQ